MDSMMNKVKEAAGKYSSHGDSHNSHGNSHNSRHKDESTLDHLKHEAQKAAFKHQANDYADDHGFSRKKHHDNKDESILDKAKDAVNKYTGHEDPHKKKHQDESMLDKAKEMGGMTNHGDSHAHKKDKDDESILDKAKEAINKYK